MDLNSIQPSDDGLRLTQLILNVNGAIQKVMIPESANVKTLGDIRSYIENYLPQGMSKYKLVIGETQTSLETSNALLPIDKGRMVADTDGTAYLTLGLYALPLMSKAGSKKKVDAPVKLDRSAITTKIKEIIATNKEAKEFFKVDGKPYTNLSTEVLSSLLDNYLSIKPKTNVKEVIVKEKAKVKTKVKTKVGQIVQGVKHSKGIAISQSYSDFDKESDAKVKALTPLVSNTSGNLTQQTKDLIKQTLTCLFELIDSIEISNEVVSDKKEPVAISNPVTVAAISFSEYVASLKNNYYGICRNVSGTKC